MTTLLEYTFPDGLINNQTVTIPISENVNKFNFYLVTVNDGSTDIFYSFMYPSTLRLGNRCPSNPLLDEFGGSLNSSKFYDIINLCVDSSGNNINFMVYRTVNPTLPIDPNNKIHVYGIWRK